jgi:uncharacterized membrane protein
LKELAPMSFRTWVEIEPVVFLLVFFVIVPAIAIAIGYAAWVGKPEKWDRSMYWTAFVASIVVSGFLMVYAQRMHADVRTWRYPLQLALFGLGALFFGVAGGCMVGIFTYRHGRGPSWRGSVQPPSSDKS